MRRLLTLTLLLALVVPPAWGQMVVPNLQNPLNRGLVSWWRGVPQMTGGDRFYDLMGRNHGTLTNMGFSSTSGWSPTDRRGGYAQIGCDGSNDYVNVAKDASLNLTEGTWALWVKRTVVGGYMDAIAMGDGAGNGTNYFRMGWITSGDLFWVEITAASVGLVGPKITVAGTDWHHLVFAVDAGGNKLYLDGLPQTPTYASGSASTTAFLSNVYGSIVSLDFCRFNANSFNNNFSGAVQDIRLWSRALTPLEVQAVYQQSLLGDPDLLRSPYGEVARGPSGVAPGSFFPFFGR